MFQSTRKRPESPWDRRKPPDPKIKPGASGVFSDRLDSYILQGSINTKSIPVMNRHIVNASDLGRILGKSEKTVRLWEEDGIISSKRIPTGGKETLLFDVPEVFADLDRYSKRVF